MVAYNSSETGRSEIFVETFPGKARPLAGDDDRSRGTSVASRWPRAVLRHADQRRRIVEVNNVAGAVRFGSPAVLFRRTDIARSGSELRAVSRWPALRRPDRRIYESAASTDQPVRMNWRSALRERLNCRSGWATRRRRSTERIQFISGLHW